MSTSVKRPVYLLGHGKSLGILAPVGSACRGKLRGLAPLMDFNTVILFHNGLLDEMCRSGRYGSLYFLGFMSINTCMGKSCQFPLNIL